MGRKAGKPNSANYALFLTLGALGVVFGDIGTSPLYALRECFHGAHAVTLNAANVLGVLSLSFWSMVIVISVKYLGVVMRADNRGEGGVLALMALTQPERGGDPQQWRRKLLIFLGLFGAALLYGDGMITPAISVLSAMEGLKVGTPLFEPYIIPITVLILIFLFFFQRYGTARIGTVFGPVILIWFSTLGLLGVMSVIQSPEILAGVNPIYGVEFFANNGWSGFAVLGSVFLAVTGGEALYADMGHFGRRPIRFGWYGVALPGLVFNYFGQGALLLRDPSVAENPFFHLAPSWALYPLVILAMMATVIASQAVISGSFSLTRQAVQLGYFPRLVITHTSAEEIGQIYVPRINWMLLIACIWLVLEFRSSSNLAAAYGIAVSMTMVITTLIVYVVARELWRWSRTKALLVVGFFLVFDLAFFGANMMKIAQGGWFPLTIGAVIFTLMTTWRKGRAILYQRMRARLVPLDKFIADLEADPPLRVDGAAVFMSGSLEGTPPALLHNVKHNRVLHKKVIIMMVMTEEIPHVSIERRVTVEKVNDDFIRIVVHYGFTDTPNVPAALQMAKAQGVDVDLGTVTYFLGRETLLATKNPGMAMWREELFAVMSANAQRATAFFQIPPDQVIEIGLQVEL